MLDSEITTYLSKYSVVSIPLMSLAFNVPQKLVASRVLKLINQNDYIQIVVVYSKNTVKILPRKKTKSSTLYALVKDPQDIRCLYWLETFEKRAIWDQSTLFLPPSTIKPLTQKPRRTQKKLPEFFSKTPTLTFERIYCLEDIF